MKTYEDYLDVIYSAWLDCFYLCFSAVGLYMSLLADQMMYEGRC